MDELNLYEYQEKYISNIRELFLTKKRIILCATTGAGKTVMFSYMTLNAFDKDKNILILTDRKELFSQTAKTLEKFGLNPSLINPKNKKIDGNLHVGMMQTLKRRLHLLEDFIKDLDLIIIDEAHKTIFDEVFKYVSEKTFVIGATATPYRDGNQQSLDIYYNDIVHIIDTPELIELQKLSKCTTYGVPVNLKGIKTKNGDYDEKSMGEKFSEIKLFHGVIENYNKICKGKKTLVFASSLASSQELVFEMQNAGLNARHVDCYMNDRQDVIEWFKNTHDAILSNYGILTTGFDEPTIECVILYRATKSLPLFLQMVGRGSRITEQKKHFTLLDFGNNVKTHGFWEQERQWNLKKKEKKEGEAPVKECPNCNYIMYASIMECPDCGYLFQSKEKEEEEQMMIYLEKLSPSQMSFKELIMFAKNKGYKDGWIWHQIKTLKQLKEYGKYKGYHWKWAQRQWENREQNTTRLHDVV
jgi:superfamily II DNA or RNA helicase